tara:strand:- start:69 stop:281 length:213 start_codon:yes stop_codon:yes gene_type:complete
MKIYKVTVTNTVLDQDRIVEVKGKNPQDAHKEALFTEVSEFDKIAEIRNSKDILVYGQQGFVNALRDQEA